MLRPAILTRARTEVRRTLARIRWRGDQAFWQEHYAQGGDSGSGSSGRLARFKAEVLNTFVADHDIGSVIEFGCGDGRQLELSSYPDYLGLDVAPVAIDRCLQRFADDPNKSFALYDPKRWRNNGWISADLAISLDVIFHLVEDESYEKYMNDLFGAARKFVIIYASNTNAPHPEAYTRHHRFTDWIDANAPDWTLARHIPNAFSYDASMPFDTSFSEFWIFARVA